MSFQEYVSETISHLVFYGDLVYKLRRVKGAADFVSPGSKIVKRFRRRKYDPVIVEYGRYYTLPFYSLVLIFPESLHSDKQGDGDYLTCPKLLRDKALILVPSDC